MKRLARESAERRAAQQKADLEAINARRAKLAEEKEEGTGGGEGFKEGDAVECRHGGGPRSYPGTVVKAHGDGTYDIDYDDGDKVVRWGPVRDCFTQPSIQF